MSDQTQVEQHRFGCSASVDATEAPDYVYPTDPINSMDLDGRCGFFGNPFKECEDKDRKDQGFLGGVFSKAARVVAGGFGIGSSPRRAYQGAVFLGSHLGTGGTWCFGSCVSGGLKGGKPFISFGGSGWGGSVDLYVFQGDACAQSGWGASAAVVAGDGGGSTVSLSDGKPVPGTSGVSLSAGGKAQYGGGTSYTHFFAGC
jgi:hypothetical protein